MKTNKKGQITFYIMFIGISLLVLFITAFVAPFGARFSSTLYVAGNSLLQQSNATIQGINDTTVRAAIQDTLEQGMASQADNINVMTSIYQYSWVFVLLIAAIATYLYTRRLSEYNQGLI